LSDSPPVLLDRIGYVALLTLNRPARANAIDSGMREALFDLTAGLATDGDVRVAVVAGSEKHFCSGADLREPSAARAASRADYPGVTNLAERLPQPVIAAVDGVALGGGLELALTCDIRIVGRNARLGLPEIQFGALPTGGGMVRLPRLIGPSAAKLMIMSGEPIDAQEALRLGLADMIAQDASARDTALALAKRLASRPAYALVTAKRVIDGSLDLTVADGNTLQQELTAAMASRAQRVAAVRSAAHRDQTYRRIFGRDREVDPT
jgi:enoyl-CoA hydratase/carnithine racemase